MSRPCDVNERKGFFFSTYISVSLYNNTLWQFGYFIITESAFFHLNQIIVPLVSFHCDVYLLFIFWWKADGTVTGFTFISSCHDNVNVLRWMLPLHTKQSMLLLCVRHRLLLLVLQFVPLARVSGLCALCWQRWWNFCTLLNKYF